MWIPTKIYEALPAIYLTIGVALIAGTLYIGLHRGLMVGYLILGLVCLTAGIVVRNVRHSARSGDGRSRS